MKSSTMLKIGDFVQAVVPEKYKANRTDYGRVDAIENYSDDNGTRQWIYVRWYGNDGKPNSECQKHAAGELEQVED